MVTYPTHPSCLFYGDLPCGMPYCWVKLRKEFLLDLIICRKESNIFWSECGVRGSSWLPPLLLLSKTNMDGWILTTDSRWHKHGSAYWHHAAALWQKLLIEIDLVFLSKNLCFPPMANLDKIFFTDFKYYITINVRRSVVCELGLKPIFILNRIADTWATWNVPNVDEVNILAQRRKT